MLFPRFRYFCKVKQLKIKLIHRIAVFGIFQPMAVQLFGGRGFLRLISELLRLCTAMQNTVLFGLPGLGDPLLLFAKPVQIYNISH